MKKITKVLCLALAVLMLSMSCTKKSSEKQILSFKFESLDVEAVIVEETKTISATIPYDADVTKLVPTIVVSEKATVNPGSNVPLDFTNPVTYTVTAEDGSQIDYKVSVTLENPFLGIWGVEKLEYYSIDYAGNPIASSMESINFNPNDIDNGIRLVFREDKTGEVHDNSLVIMDLPIVTSFTYSYNSDASRVYINKEDNSSYVFNVIELKNDSFVYENEYISHQIEKAYLKKLSDASSKSNNVIESPFRPYKQGSLLSGK